MNRARGHIRSGGAAASVVAKWTMFFRWLWLPPPRFSAPASARVYDMSQKRLGFCVVPRGYKIKACRELLPVLYVDVGALGEKVKRISITPSSLSAFNTYRKQLVQRGIKIETVVTGMDKVDRGYHFRFLGSPTPEEKRRVLCATGEDDWRAEDFGFAGED